VTEESVLSSRDLRKNPHPTPPLSISATQNGKRDKESEHICPRINISVLVRRVIYKSSRGGNAYDWSYVGVRKVNKFHRCQ